MRARRRRRRGEPGRPGLAPLGLESEAEAGLAAPARAHPQLLQPSGSGAQRGCGPQGGRAGAARRVLAALGRESPPGFGEQ